MGNARSLFRLGSRALAIMTVVRQVRQARQEGDKLRTFDAVVNGLAVVTALLILVREIRERSDDSKAINKAGL